MALAYAAVTWLVAFVLIEGGRWGFSWRAVRDDVIGGAVVGGAGVPFQDGGGGDQRWADRGWAGRSTRNMSGYIDPDSILAGQSGAS